MLIPRARSYFQLLGFISNLQGACFFLNKLKFTDISDKFH